MTTVFNLADNRELTFNLTPTEAVVAAYEQDEHNNYDFPNYDLNKAKISSSSRSVICGNWCALTD